MSGWYSNLVGATTSKISNLQRTFLSSEADGDTEDDTHVCRVLRSYYTEKGRPFPGWLPPDPKAPPPVAAVYSQPTQVGSRYGGLTQQPQGGSLSSLWDNNPVSQPQDAQSLRRGRGVPPPMRNADVRNNQFRNSDPVQARPLPSQRAGSYQTAGPMGGRDAGTAPPVASGGGTAQDRLKQRLFGGSRTTSPAAAGPFTPPPPSSGRGNSNYGGGGSADYEDRFAPGGMYDGGPGRGGSERPFMGANSPWSNSEADMSGSGSGGRLGGRRAGGLPSGPRGMR
ncbi:Uu.00g094170.m01.CDS01 [Anthostomella pinea]|uniref:Uu.00g094170.m01.CDS01 n=1 Tax=Anthostomella pinea TaxID=933095 RepID=A0AAI8VPJ6_9PEZI|nr:Uu.00g094170.m01.CDS01 [Anthostomella pinea]